MARLLLDTHVPLWSLAEPARLTDRARDAIEDPDNDVFVSAITAWEISVKRTKGRMVAAGPESTGNGLESASAGLESTGAGLESASTGLARLSGAPGLALLAAEPLSGSALAEGLEHRSVSAGLNRVTHRLLKSGRAEYTVPDEPNSRLEKYRITPAGHAALEEPAK